MAANPPRFRWRNQWAISFYTGPSPLQLSPANGDPTKPMLTGREVTDIPCNSVADPFLIREGDGWNLFFEVVNGESDRGEIAYATSEDGLRWKYGAVILREPFHLSYPFVFRDGGNTYMIPETRQDECVRLYIAEQFPNRWRCVTKLLTGRFADATLVHHDERWWLFAQRGLDELRLFWSADLRGRWHEHPNSPLWPGNRTRTRPGGRMIHYRNRLLRFAQDGFPSYGSRLRVFEVDRLDTGGYAEHELPESPIFAASGSGWNAVAMHHIDAVERSDGSWLAAVDGATLGLF